MKRNKKTAIFGFLIILGIIFLIWLLQASQGSNHAQIFEYKFDTKQPKTTLMTPDNCILATCQNFNGLDSLITLSNHISGIRSIVILLKPGQIDNSGIVDFGNNYSILVKNGQVKLNSPKPLLPFSPQINSKIFINGKQSATLFPYYWQLLVITFNQAINSDKLTFGQVSNSHFQGFIEDAKLYNYELTSEDVQQQLTDLLNQVKSKNTAQ